VRPYQIWRLCVSPNFLELGTSSSGAKIIQIGKEGDEPIVAVAYTDDPWSEDLNPVELYSLLKMLYDHYSSIVTR
jgi:hypothetical protein